MDIKSGKEVVADSHKRGSKVTKEVALDLSEAEFRTKIDDLIHARGISQRQLSELTGIQISYLSDIILGKTTTINKTHILALMSALRVTNVGDIFEVKLPEPLEQKFNEESYEWIDTKDVPESVKELALTAMKARMES